MCFPTAQWKRMSAITPSSPDEIAELLRDANSRTKLVSVVGNNSKRLMAGPVSAADTVISTAGLRRILGYESSDLTISAEAGVPFAKLQETLAQKRQMIALDPPFAPQASVGGVVASNSSGTMRRGFGTARDLVIGMCFATLEGKIIRTGGLVVKNVAGLDIGKLLIGSFGTLAVITSVNFRVHSLPQETRTFVFNFPDLDSAIEKRNAIVRSVLQPMAVDLISPPAAARLGMRGYTLAVRGCGSPAVIRRYARDLETAESMTGQQETSFWQTVREFSPDFLQRQPGGIVLRVSTTLTDIGTLLKLVSGACISRAGSGVTYVYLSSSQGVSAIWNAAKERGWSAVIEFAPDNFRTTKDLWLHPLSAPETSTFAMMKKIKQMFDPQNLLNRSRLYGRI
jgi:glycolate oxidase FAD binding subunit